MIHTFYDLETGNFSSLDDAKISPAEFKVKVAEAEKKVAKGLYIIHQGEIHISKI